MLFGKYINKYYKKYWWAFLLGLIALVTVDVVQTFIPEQLGRIIDEDNILVTDLNELGSIVGRIMLFASIMFVGRIVWRLTIFHASTGIGAGIRRDMFQKAEQLDTTFYHRNKVGNIMNWFTSDVEEIHEFFGWGSVMIVDAIFLSASVLVQMIRMNILLTLIIAVPVLLIIIWGALVERFMSIKWENRQKEYDRLYDFAQENFAGIRVIKSFVKANQEIHAFAKIAKKNKDTNVNFARFSVLFDVSIEIIIVAEMAMLLGFGSYFLYCAVTGNPIMVFGQAVKLSVGGLIQFVGYVDLLIWPMIALGQIISMRSRAKGSLRRITAFLDTPIDVRSPENAVKIDSSFGRIEFRHLTFCFPDSDAVVLDDVSVVINPGEHVGVVGKVGSGKSTLMNVLFRLYNLPKGTLFLDEVDVMDADIDSLRSVLAYAPQDNFLFSDTIENNVSFAKNEAVTVQEAAQFADLEKDVKSFQEGYGTTTGERGVTLSGGQKQRVSIARAYYKSAPILVLDDCVSAVDLSTEETILQHIASMRKGKTTILVASRVSSVLHMDKILVMDHGKLIAVGKHEELLKSCPVYARMVALQELEAASGGGDVA